MLHVIYSNRLERLADALARTLHASRDLRDPLDSTTLIVPNHNVGRWLKLYLSERLGIVAGLQIHYLESYFRDALLAAQTPAANRIILQAHLIDLLQDHDLLLHEDLGPVYRWLSCESQDERDIRVYQLSQRLARLFDDYSTGRPRMLERWSGSDEQVNDEAVWQRQLWRYLHARDAQPLVHQLRAQPTETYIDPSEPLYVFGLSYMAQAWYDVIWRVARVTDVRVFSLNPCMEFWEDVPTGWNVPAHGRYLTRQNAIPPMHVEEEEDFFSELEDPLLLRLWGKPGRDSVRFLNELTDGDFQSEFEDPQSDGTSILRRLQNEILIRSPGVEDGPVDESDESLLFLATPSVYREVDAIVNEILRRIDASRDSENPLAFHDIAVIVNEQLADEYQTKLRAAFAAAGKIPHNISDVRASRHRPYFDGVRRLLELPFGAFTRAQMLQVLVHPNVLEGVDGADPGLWVRWCDELGIVHGADRSDHAHTYIDEDVFHWEQGLTRLALGSFMVSQMGNQAQVYESENFRQIPLEIASSDMEAAASFSWLVRRLIDDCRSLRRKPRTIQQWCDAIAAYVDAYLTPISDDDVFDRLRFLEVLADLGQADIDTEVRLRVVERLLQNSMDRLQTSWGPYLVDGVTVSSFLPMRPIPFRVIFVAGLHEKSFPRPERNDPLDIRRHKSERGDVSPRQRDQYMFLETLLSARDALIVSWVARDEQTGETLSPSSVVRELQWTLRERHLSEESLEARTRHIPIRRFDRGYFQNEAPALPQYFEAAAAEHRALILRDELAEFCKRHELTYPRDLQVVPIHDHQRAAVRAELGLHEVPEENTTSRSRMDVGIWELRRFLREPLTGSAAFHLGFSEESTHDPFAVEDEAFESTALARARLLSDVFGQWWAAGGQAPLESVYRQTEAMESLSGVLPTGIFLDAERGRNIRVLQKWRDNLFALGFAPDRPLTVAHFGVLPAPHWNLAMHLPLELEVTSKDSGVSRVRLVGNTLPFDPSRKAFLSLKLTRPQKWYWEPATFMDGWLDALIVSAAGIHADERWDVAVNFADEIDPYRQTLPLPRYTAEHARGILQTIVSELVAGVHTRRMPLEALVGYWSETYGTSFAAHVGRFDASRWRFRPKLGPLRNLQNYPVEANVDEVAQRRLGEFLRICSEHQQNT